MMEKLGLEGRWNLRRLADGSERPMAVPGDILSALLEAGEIPDPYYADNELGLQWIGAEDWEFRRDFTTSEAFLAHDRVFLDIEVLDTVAELRLNGELLGESRNMFRRFRADCKRLLKPGPNTLSVTIRSPEKAAAALAAALPYPIPASTYPVSSPHRNLLRKAQCMAGWDWGPCLMTGGLYDGVSLVAIDGPRVDYATTRMRRAGATWLVEVEVELDADAAGPVRLEASITGPRAPAATAARAASAVSAARASAPASPDLPAPLAREALLVEAPAGPSRHKLDLVVESPELWWPAGCGAQPLYELRVAAAPAASVHDSPAAASYDSAAARGHELTKRLGFRELRVVAEEDEAGRSMKFVANGREVFAKGANWIPADALPSRWTRGRIAGLLRSAVEANMNCLRVWGGGRYESDSFYELCDELGLLVWQDCMFSCALYPSSPDFLAEVEAEIRHQVRRLKDHPALGLWCGNNEALGAITWYEESKKSPARYIVDYDRLTEGVLGRVARELDPDRAWWPSSPSAGPNDFSDNWHSDGRGDMHYWAVWHEGKPFADYLEVRPRFCSEFGFQSLPSARTVASFAPDGERNVTSPAMEHHQRHPRGNTLIVETMLRYFRMPSGFRETLYLSEVQQALAIKTAVEYWRSLRPRCMGTLYWQLNDVWPVASWSSLEYDGGWKLLHYEARRFYDELLLALVLKDGAVRAVAVNDGRTAYAGRLGLALRRFDGSLVAEFSATADLAGEAATLLWEAPLSDLGLRPTEVFLEARLTATPAGPVSPEPAGGPGRERRATLFLTEPKKCALADPRLESRIVTLGGGAGAPAGLGVELIAAAPAFFVKLEAEGLAGRFEDSGFHLAAGERRFIRFLPATDLGAAGATAADLGAALRILHLRASYE
ncbi:MAG: glycoside hydrolase family 2 protein [Spirochaetaceae bacterium]|nr:glycoside hydrolase family 2 protein [Spirochaetaceae bacterium]